MNSGTPCMYAIVGPSLPRAFLLDMLLYSAACVDRRPKNVSIWPPLLKQSVILKISFQFGSRCPKVEIWPTKGILGLESLVSWFRFSRREPGEPKGPSGTRVSSKGLRWVEIFPSKEFWMPIIGIIVGWYSGPREVQRSPRKSFSLIGCAIPVWSAEVHKWYIRQRNLRLATFKKLCLVSLRSKGGLSGGLYYHSKTTFGDFGFRSGFSKGHVVQCTGISFAEDSAFTAVVNQWISWFEGCSGISLRIRPYFSAKSIDFRWFR